MQWTGLNELRDKYLTFFEGKGHLRLDSFPLVPKNDPSLLLINSGMAPMKKWFLAQEEPPRHRVTTCQKCIRTPDIERVGITARHGTFFEMLGNFSFQDYFKEEVIPWAWEFLTSDEWMAIPKDKLHISVYEEDDEAYDIWTKKVGVAPDHMVRLGKEDNFWEHGSGPCGPCSEIYFDRGPEYGCGKPTCGVGCDCDRYMEIWNLVFSQFDADGKGHYERLARPNIDTGMGLERLACVMQGVGNLFEVDTVQSVLHHVEHIAGKTYGADPKEDISIRVITDHIRSCTFMVSDGILPSNEGRGYVLRRLLRRAVMKGHLLGLDKPFLNDYVDEIVNLMGHVYPEIVENRELTRRVILSEEERFGANLRQGRAFLDEALAELEGEVLPGDRAFTLHDTYGFPVEVTRELCDERGIEVDMEGFGRCMDEQRERARAANTKDAEAAWSTYGGVMNEILEAVGPTEFLGYTKNDAEARVLALVKDGVQVDVLEAGDEGRVVLDATPFYAEKGGQIGDAGVLAKDDAIVAVLDTKEPEKGLIAHTVKVESGRLSAGDAVHAAIDVPRRERIRRNHTATHILHWALREVLGDHVKQAGSYVADSRLRFDFTHFEAMTAEQIAEVERLANQKIMENHPVRAYETSLASAREAGVMALFGEKYGEFVRVLDIEGFSQELCGGTHVSATSEIGFVKITSETSVGANLRRIEAVTSFDALAYMNRVEAELKEAAESLRVPLFDVSERTASNMKTLKDLQTKLKRGREAVADDGINALLETAQTSAAGYPVVFGRMPEADAGQMRNMWDVLRTRLGQPGAAVLATEKDGKPTLLAAGTPEAVEAGFDAGAVIKAISGNIKGGGGGKAAMAQAGGKDASGIDAALQAARDMLL